MENLNTVFSNIETPEADQKIGRAINTMLKHQLKSELKNDLKASFGIEKQREKIFRMYKMMGGIAASLVLVIAAWIALQPNADYNTLLTDYTQATPMQHPGMTKGLDNKSREVAILAYNTKKWDLAVRSFGAIDQPNANDLFYMALSKFYKGDYNAAKASFNNLPTSNYGEEVVWFKALSLMKLGELDVAKQNLESIQPGQWKYKEAQQLLKQDELKNIK